MDHTNDATDYWAKYSERQLVKNRVSTKVSSSKNLLHQLNVALKLNNTPADRDVYPSFPAEELLRGSSTRDNSRIRQLRQQRVVKIGSWTSKNQIWVLTLAGTISSHSTTSKQDKPQLLLIISCNLRSSAFHVSFKGTVATYTEIPSYKSERYGSISVHDLGGPNWKHPEPLKLNDVHHIAVQEYDLDGYIEHMNECTVNCKGSFYMRFNSQGEVRLVPRLNLIGLRSLLQTHRDIVTYTADVGKLSLWDIQNLVTASSKFQLSLANETEHRIRTSVARYFPHALAEFTTSLLENDALLSGSTPLYILKPGNWYPNDLDIVLPEAACNAFEHFLIRHGYKKDSERQKTLRCIYPAPWESSESPATFRYECFTKGHMKIDLWYISAPATPITHLLAYHSTAVMNFFDGRALHCLFPERTFAGTFVENHRYRGSPVKLELGLEKLRGRGFDQTGGQIDEWYPEALSTSGTGELLFEKLPMVWAQEATCK